MLRSIFLYCIPIVFGYELLQHYIPSSPTKVFYSENLLRDYSDEVCNYINDFNIHRCIISPTTGSINTISVSYTNDYYLGYTKLYNTSQTDIIINHKLLKTKNTLYNVLLHEMIHSFGLNHSNEYGIMNYSIRVNERNEILEDSNKLYLSTDDIRGLKYIKRTMKCLQ